MSLKKIIKKTLKTFFVFTILISLSMISGLTLPKANSLKHKSILVDGVSAVDKDALVGSEEKESKDTSNSKEVSSDAPIKSTDSEINIEKMESLGDLGNSLGILDIPNLKAMKGSGTKTNPFQISTATQLEEIAVLTNQGKLAQTLMGVTAANESKTIVYFKQTENINLSTVDPAKDGSGDWIPIGTNSNPFYGSYNGDNWTISGLTYGKSRPNTIENVGLFGKVDGSAIKIKDPNQPSIQNVGVINSQIENNNLTNVGAIAGNLSGAIVKSLFTDASIIVSSDSNTVSVGGLIGYTSGASKISNSVIYSRFINALDSTSAQLANIHRIVGNSDTATTSTLTLEKNYSYKWVSPHVDGCGGTPSWNGTETNKDGLDKLLDDLSNETFWANLGISARPSMPSYVTNDSTYVLFQGVGTSASPYQINTAADLKCLANVINTASEDAKYNSKTINYKLMSDIDLGGQNSYYQKTDSKGNGGWVSIGNNSSHFKANFDGNNKSVSGLYIADGLTDGVSIGVDNSKGLFGVVGASATADTITIKNLTISGSISYNISENYSNIGSLIGSSYYANVSGVTSDVTISVNSSSSKGSNVGGVVGTANEGSNINNVNNKAVITVQGTAETNIGGIVGLATVADGVSVSSKIESSYNIADLIATSKDALLGGIVGKATAKVSVSKNVLLSKVISPISIHKGRIVAAIGEGSQVTNNYGYFGTDGQSTDCANASIWTNNINGKDGLHLQLKDINAAFWTNLSITSPPNPLPTWITDDIVNEDNFFEGTGSNSDPYKILSGYELKCLASVINGSVKASKYNTKSVYYKLFADIDLGGVGSQFQPVGADGIGGWIPIGLGTAFKANFDGGGYVVSDMYINTPVNNRGDFGLFGTVEGTSTSDKINITNVGVSGAVYTSVSNNSTLRSAGLIGSAKYINLTGVYSITSVVSTGNDIEVGPINTAYSGGIVGTIASSTISNVVSIGSISGVGNFSPLYIGAIAGYIDSVTITNAYSRSSALASSSVVATVYVGGLVGMAEAKTSTFSITNAFVVNSVNGEVSQGSVDIGGIVGASTGANTSKISNCVSLNQYVNSRYESDATITINKARIIATPANITLANNYGYFAVNIDSSDCMINNIWASGLTTKDGLDVYKGDIEVGSWWTSVAAGGGPSFTTADWDISGISSSNGALPFIKNIPTSLLQSNTTPLYIANFTPGALFVGSGSQADPYQIPSVSKLACLATIVNNNIFPNQFNTSSIYYSQTNDIDLGGAGATFQPINAGGVGGWTPIGNSENTPFKANFISDKRYIQEPYINDYVSTSDKIYKGIFGYTDGAKIEGVSAFGGSITVSTTIPDSTYVATIVAKAKNTTISACSSTTLVSVNSTVANADTTTYVGGIVASAIGSSVIDQCFNLKPVSVSTPNPAPVPSPTISLDKSVITQGDPLSLYLGNFPGNYDFKVRLGLISIVTGTTSALGTFEYDIPASVTNTFPVGENQTIEVIPAIGGDVQASVNLSVEAKSQVLKSNSSSYSKNLGATAINATLTTYSGGIAGSIEGSSKITNSYNTASISSVSGSAISAGIVGSIAGTSEVSNVYNTGDVTANSQVSSNIGGIAGYNAGNSTKISNSVSLSKEIKAKGAGAAVVNRIGPANSLTSNYGYLNVNSQYVAPTCDALGIQNGWNSGLTSTDGLNIGKSDIQTTSWWTSNPKFSTTYWDMNGFSNGYSLPIMVNISAVQVQSKTTPSYISIDSVARYVFSGNGTTSSPFLLKTQDDLVCLAKIVNNNILPDEYNKDTIRYKLNNDIDLGGAGSSWQPVNNNGYGGWTPIANSNSFFAGFDGNKKTISNLYIAQDTTGLDQYKGLFGRLDLKNGATITGLAVTGSITIRGGFALAPAYAGGIAGMVVGSTTISYCLTNVTIYVSNNNAVYGGGIVGAVRETGSSQVEISNSANLGNITVFTASRNSSTVSYAAGIVGWLYSFASQTNAKVKITDCYNTGNISSLIDDDNALQLYSYSGGIIPYLDTASTIDKCYNTGTISSQSRNPYAGGIAGFVNASTLKNSVSLSKNIYAQKTPKAGGELGLYGRIFANKAGTTTTENNYGFSFSGNTLQCYNNSSNWTSAIAGKDGQNIALSNVNSNTWWKNTSAGSGPAFSTSSWSIADNMMPTLLSMSSSATQNSVVPNWISASSQAIFQGSGTDANPYLITNADELYCLGQIINKAHEPTKFNTWAIKYKITNDISLSGPGSNYQPVDYEGNGGWDPIGTATNPFRACVDGGNHTIHDLFILNDKLNNVGFFGVINTSYYNNQLVNAQWIKSLGLASDCVVASNITGFYNELNIGSFAGLVTSPYIDATHGSSIQLTYISSAASVYSYALNGDPNSKINVGGLIGKLTRSVNINMGTYDGQAKVEYAFFDGNNFNIIANNEVRAGGIVGVIAEFAGVFNAYNRANIRLSTSGNPLGFSKSVLGGVAGFLYNSLKTPATNRTFNLGSLYGQGIASVSGIVGKYERVVENYKSLTKSIYIYVSFYNAINANNASTYEGGKIGYTYWYPSVCKIPGASSYTGVEPVLSQGGETSNAIANLGLAISNNNQAPTTTQKLNFVQGDLPSNSFSQSCYDLQWRDVENWSRKGDQAKLVFNGETWKSWPSDTWSNPPSYASEFNDTANTQGRCLDNNAGGRMQNNSIFSGNNNAGNPQRDWRSEVNDGSAPSYHWQLTNMGNTAQDVGFRMQSNYRGRTSKTFTLPTVTSGPIIRSYKYTRTSYNLDECQEGNTHSDNTNNGTSFTKSNIENWSFWGTVSNGMQLDSAVWNTVSTGKGIPTIKNMPDGVPQDQTTPWWITDAPTVAPFTVGDGTSAKPYEIKNELYLKCFADIINKSITLTLSYNIAQVYYKLTSDIDLGGYGSKYQPVSTKGWVPIGSTAANAFRASFDGQAHKISNLYINQRATDTSAGVGFFGYADTYPGVKTASLQTPLVIKNLIFDNAYIDTVATNNTSAKVGILVGNVINSTNCQQQAKISNIVTDGSIYVDSEGASKVSAGGIIGNLYQAIMTFSSSSARVYVNDSDLSYVGGLVGETSFLKDTSTTTPIDINNCYYASASAYSLFAGGGSTTSVGGILGFGESRYSTLTVKNNYVLGSASISVAPGAKGNIGGIVGYFTYANTGMTFLYNNVSIVQNLTVVSGDANIGRIYANCVFNGITDDGSVDSKNNYAYFGTNAASKNPCSSTSNVWDSSLTSKDGLNATREDFTKEDLEWWYSTASSTPTGPGFESLYWGYDPNTASGATNEVLPVLWQSPEMWIRITDPVLVPDWIIAKLRDFSGGTGTQSNPFRISSGSDLSCLAEYINNSTDDSKYNNSSVYYSVENDVDLGGSGSTYQPVDTNGIGGWVPIGDTSATPFKANFDGSDKTISNLFVKKSGSISGFGLFGYTNGAKFSDFNIADSIIDITSTSAVNVGTLASSINSSTTIEDVNTSGTIKVSSSKAVISGGLVGDANISLISNLFSNVAITISASSSSTVGGIAGVLQGSGSKISNTHTSENIIVKTSGAAIVGGIVGKASTSATIDTGFSTSFLNTQTGSTSVSIGSIAGSIDSVTIKNTVALAKELKVETSTSVNRHRIVGATSGTNTLQNNYGYFAMNNFWESCSGSSTTTWTDNITGQDGKNVGKQSLKQSNWWFNSTSGNGPSFSTTYWHFVALGINALPYILTNQNDINQDSSAPAWIENFYQYLFAGSGTQADPYQLNDLDTLSCFASVINNAVSPAKYNTSSIFYKVMNDLNLGGPGGLIQSVDINGNGGFKSIGNSTSPFKANFNGNNKSLLNLFENSNVTTDGFYGIFGNTDGAIIKDFIVTGSISLQTTSNGAVSATIGSIVANGNNTTIENVANKASIVTGSKTAQIVGGIAGSIKGSSKINNCYNAGNVNSHSSLDDTSLIVGGIVGKLDGSSVSNTYADSYISGSNRNGVAISVGGIAGVVTGSTASVKNSVSLSKTVASYNVTGSKATGTYHRIAGTLLSSATLANNYAYWGQSGTSLNVCSGDSLWVSAINGVDGLNTIKDNIILHTWWTSTATAGGPSFSSSIWTTGNITTGNAIPALSSLAQNLQVTKTPSYFDNIPTVPTYFSGSGSQNAPYEIKTETDLACLSKVINNGSEPTKYNAISVYYKLLNNIDFNGKNSTVFTVGADGFGGFTPIGTSDNPFKANFDGGSKTLSNIHINSSNSQYIGLFGNVLGQSGTALASIKNIALNGGEINSTSTETLYTGALIANGKYANIENVYSVVPINSSSAKNSITGGLIGSLDASVVNTAYTLSNVVSKSTFASATPYSTIGGIAGTVNASTLKNSYSSSSVTLTATKNQGRAGGITGDATQTSKINNCVSIGKEIVNTTVASSVQGRITGVLETSSTSSSVYAYQGMLVSGAVVTGGTVSNKNGLNISNLDIPYKQNWEKWFDNVDSWYFAESDYGYSTESVNDISGADKHTGAKWMPVLKGFGTSTKLPSPKPLNFVDPMIGSQIGALPIYLTTVLAATPLLLGKDATGGDYNAENARIDISDPDPLFDLKYTGFEGLTWQDVTWKFGLTPAGSQTATYYTCSNYKVVNGLCSVSASNSRVISLGVTSSSATFSIPQDISNYYTIREQNFDKSDVLTVQAISNGANLTSNSIKSNTTSSDPFIISFFESRARPSGFSMTANSVVYGVGTVTLNTIVTSANLTNVPSGTVSFSSELIPDVIASKCSNITVTQNSPAAGSSSASCSINTTSVKIPTGVRNLKVDYSGSLAFYPATATLDTALTTPKPLTIGGLTSPGKVYDAGLSIPVTGPATITSGIVSYSGVADSVNVVGSPTGTLDTKGAATGKRITVGGLNLDGSDKGNYSLPNPLTISGNVTKKPLTISNITVTPTKVYDGTITSSYSGTIKLNGIESGDTVSVASSAAVYENKNVADNKKVTISATTGGTDKDNYTITALETSANITKKPITINQASISINNKVYDGNTVATFTGTPTFTGILDADKANVSIASSTAVYENKNVAIGKKVTVNVVLSGSEGSNYSVTSLDLTGNITPKALTINPTSITINNKVYDSTDTATFTGTPVLVGVLDADKANVQVDKTTAVFTNENIGVNIPVNVTVTIKGSESGNYIVDVLTKTANITTQILTLSGLSSADKVYDATTVATITGNVVLNGVIAGDDTVLSGAPIGNFDNKNVGTDKTVTVSGLTLAGTTAGNYTLQVLTFKQAITKRPVTITGITANNKVYDTNTTTAISGTATIDNNLDGNNLTLVATSATYNFDNKNVGTNKPVTVLGYTLGGSMAGNYELPASPNNQTKSQLTAAITKRPVTITGITADDKVYNNSTQALISGTATIDNNLDGNNLTLVATAATYNFDNKNVGTNKPVTVLGYTLAGSMAGNYELPASPNNQTKSQLTATITKKPVTINGLSGVSRMYDSTNIAQLQGTPDIYGNLDGTNLKLTGTPIATFNDKNVGTGKPITVLGYTLGGSMAGNYELPASPNNQTQSILNANITVKNDISIIGISATKNYDGTTTAPVTGTANIDGVCSGDNLDIAYNSQGTYDTSDAGVDKMVTVSGIILSGLDKDNYSIAETQVLKIGIIIANKPVYVTGIKVSDKVYDGDTSIVIDTSTATLTGLDASDVGVVTLNKSNAVGAFASKNANNNIEVRVTGMFLEGDTTNKYFLMPYITSANITKKPLDIISDSITISNKIYDTNATAEHTGTPALNGVVANDVTKVQISSITANFDNKNVGINKLVTISATITGAESSNYTVNNLSKNQGNISKRDVTISGLFASNKIYDKQTNATVTGTAIIDNNLDGSNLSLIATGATYNFTDENVSDGKLIVVTGYVLDGSERDNYSLPSAPNNQTTISLTADVTKKPVTISGLTTKDRIYNGLKVATIEGTATIEGNLDGANVALNSSAATHDYADKNVANDKVITVSGYVLTGTKAGNYELPASPANQTTTVLKSSVTPLELTISGLIANDKVYDSTDVAKITGTIVFNNKVSTDSISLVGNPTGKFSDKNANVPTPPKKNVDILSDGLGLSGVDAINYTLPSPIIQTSSANISRLPVNTLSGLVANKKADGTVQVTLTGTPALSDKPKYPNDVVNISYNQFATFDSPDVGENKDVAVTGVLLSGTDANNYEIPSLVIIKGSITDRIVVTVGGIVAYDRVYDADVNATINATNATITSGVSLADSSKIAVSYNSFLRGDFADKNVGQNKTVTIRGLTLQCVSGTNCNAEMLDNYQIGTTTTKASITPLEIAVTGLSASDKIYNGNDNASILGSAQPVGVLSDPNGVQDSISITGTPSGKFSDKNVDSHKLVSVTNLAISGTDSNNYKLGTINAILTASITPLKLSISGISVNDKSYDGTTSASVSGSLSLTNVVSGDDLIPVGSPRATFSNKNAGTGISVTISNIDLAGSDVNNYVLPDNIVYFANINPKKVTVTNVSARDKVYDGTTSARILGSPSINGIITADRALVSITGTPVAIFSDKNVANNKTVTVTGYSLTGDSSLNYYLPQDQCDGLVKASITPKTDVSIEGLTAVKRYDSSTDVPISGNAVLNGKISNDSVTVNYDQIGHFDDPEIATNKPVTVTNVHLTGVDAINYKVPESITIIGSIFDRLPLTINGIKADNKVYDGTNSVSIDINGATLSGIDPLYPNVNLDFSKIDASFADKLVANDKNIILTLNDILTGDDADEYALFLPSLTANITPVQLTIGGTFTAADKVYDGTDLATITGSPSIIGNIVDGDNVNISGRPVGKYVDGKGVGTNKSVSVSGFSLSGADASNYIISSIQSNVKGDITKKDVYISGIKVKDKEYDNTTSAQIDGSYALTGGISGDSVSISGIPSATFDSRFVGENKDITISGIALSGEDKNNYNLLLPELKASITPKKLTVEDLVAESKEYDRNTSAAITGTSRLVGVIGTNVVNITGTPVGTFNNKNAGVDKDVAVTGLTLTGGDAINYTLSLPILKAAIYQKTSGVDIEGINANSKIYDGSAETTLSGTARLDGKISGDDVSLSGAAVATFANSSDTANDGKNVGNNKTVILSGLILSGKDALNYKLPTPIKYLIASIEKRPLTIEGLTAVKRYDGGTSVNVNGTARLSGLVLGDNVSLTRSNTGTFADPAVGQNKPVTLTSASLSGADAANYSITSPVVIYGAIYDKYPLTITNVVVSDKVYDGTTNIDADFSNASLTGLQAGLNKVSLDVSAASAHFSDKNVNTNKPVSVDLSGITISGDDADSYVLYMPAITANITPKTLTLRDNLSAENKVYDGNTFARIIGDPDLDGIIPGDSPLMRGTAVGLFLDKGVGLAKTVEVSGISLQGSDAVNYVLPKVLKTLYADITPRSLSVSGLQADDKVYDGTTNASISGDPVVSLDDLVPNDQIAFNGSATGQFNDKNVGTNKPVTVSGLTLVGADAANYILVEKEPLRANITKKKIELIGVDDPSESDKVYDGNTDAGGVSGNPYIVDSIFGDEVYVSLDNASAEFDDKNVGTDKLITIEGIELYGPDADNYEVIPPTSTGTINPKQVSIEGVKVKDKGFDGGTAAQVDTSSKYTVVGLLEEDKSKVTLDYSCVEAEFEDPAIGYKTVTVYGLDLVGDEADNYVLIYDVNPDIEYLTQANILDTSNPEFISLSPVYNSSSKLLTLNFEIKNADKVVGYTLQLTSNAKVTYTAKPVSFVIAGSQSQKAYSYSFNASSDLVSHLYRAIYRVELKAKYFALTEEKTISTKDEPTIGYKTVDISLKNSTSVPNFPDISKLGSGRQTAIKWMAKKGVTVGSKCAVGSGFSTTKTCYKPSDVVNRGAMAEFMRSDVGAPLSYKTSPKISDISKLGSGRQTAIKWLAAEKVTTLSGTKYNPQNPVNRGSMAEFLWNLAGKPTVTDAMVSAGKKVLNGDYKVIDKLAKNRAKAVYWMAYNKITIGAKKADGKTYYEPSNPVNRGSMAEFLMKFHDMLHLSSF